MAGGSVARSSVDGDHAAPVPRQHRELALDLSSQLASGDEDEGPGVPGLGPNRPGHDGQSESQRLPRPRRGAAAHVAPGQDLGKRGHLNGERTGNAPGGEAGDQIGAHPEIGK
jgi:hypothetical protein